MGIILDRIHALGLQLPPVHPHTNKNRTACVRSGNVLYLSGHSSGRHELPLGVITAGKVGTEVPEEEACKTARSEALVIMASLQAYTGDLDRITRIIRLFGMVNSAPGFERQFAVMDGASDLFYEVWGPDRGCHARTAVGIAELPRRAVIEINGEFEIDG
jgi:enamine deaminase RidA (YjgF/YER057c/UK114 family)